MLCSSHRDHKSFDRCPRRHSKPRLQEPQRRLPRPGKRGQEVTPRLGDSGRPLRDPGAPTIPTASLRLSSRCPCVDHMYQLIFKGPPADKQITLIKVGEHYHGCNSLPGFLGKHGVRARHHKSTSMQGKKVSSVLPDSVSRLSPTWE